MINDALLKSVYLFADLDGTQRGEFAKIAEVLSLSAEHTIFDVGNPATALFLIRDGTVRITTTSPGARIIDVATLGPGSHFGEMALVDNAPRSATAKTLEPTAVFRFDYEKKRALLDRSPPIASIFYRALAHFLSHRLRQTTTDLTFAREKNLRYF
jgi:CRP/FNR family transcriptional regulator, cyclic AMP receptor protein